MVARRTFLRQAFLLWIAGVIGMVAALPFYFHMNAALLGKAAAKGVTTPLLAALLVLQLGVYLAVAVPVGLWAASRLGLRAPVSEALAKGRSPREGGRPFLATAVLAGAATGAVVWLLSVF